MFGGIYSEAKQLLFVSLDFSLNDDELEGKLVFFQDSKNSEVLFDKVNQ